MIKTVKMYRLRRPVTAAVDEGGFVILIIDDGVD
jgi:hypothetical protein